MSDQPTDPHTTDDQTTDPETTDRDTTGPATVAADERDAHAAHDPDRAPSPDEEEVAERVASDVDLDRVGEHEQELTRLGADVDGEGRIV